MSRRMGELANEWMKQKLVCEEKKELPLAFIPGPYGGNYFRLGAACANSISSIQ